MLNCYKHEVRTLQFINYTNDCIRAYDDLRMEMRNVLSLNERRLDLCCLIIDRGCFEPDLPKLSVLQY